MADHGKHREWPRGARAIIACLSRKCRKQTTLRSPGNGPGHNQMIPCSFTGKNCLLNDGFQQFSNLLVCRFDGSLKQAVISTAIGDLKIHLDIRLDTNAFQQYVTSKPF